MTKLYNCRVDGDQHRISKFDADLNVESSYLTNGRECDCPAGHRPICRHRTMLPRFLAKPGADRGLYFHNFEQNQWVRVSVGDDCAEGAEVEIASMVTLPDDCSSEDVANAFAGLRQSAAAHGFTMLDLANPLTTHNAIATAVGEPLIGARSEPSTPLRRP